MKRKKIGGWIGLGLLSVLLGMQLIRPVKNAGEATGANDITRVIPTSGGVQQVLAASCYDCHSNHTEYPWYTEVMPVGWWIGHHVEEGKEELNFTEAGSYAVKKLDHKLEEIEEEVREGKMPPSDYTRIHEGAKLTGEQKQLLYDWVKEGREVLRN